MDVTSAITLMDFIGKVGIPFVVTCGVLFIVWKIGNTIPSSIKSFVSTITEQEKKQYVIDFLNSRGIKLTAEELDVLIEAAVKELSLAEDAFKEEESPPVQS